MYAELKVYIIIMYGYNFCILSVHTFKGQQNSVWFECTSKWYGIPYYLNII